LSAVTVETEAVILVNEYAATIQNLGADDLYVDIEDNVSSSTGLRVVAGDSVPVGANETYYGISTGSSDVRILPGGIGGPATLQSA
jgi:hypothetical protein